MKNSSLAKQKSSQVFAHVHLKPTEQIDMHHQSSWELSYIVTGRGVRTIGDTSEAFYPGEVVLVVPEMEHFWDFDPMVTDSQGMIENYTIQFQTSVIEQMALLFPEFQHASQMLLEMRQRESVRFQADTAQKLIALFRQMDRQSVAEQSASLLHMIVVISESEDSEVVGRFVTPTLVEDRLKEIDIYVSCNYKREITIDQIATHVGMNRTSFCSFFKKQKDMTFITYLNRYRMEIACYLLRNPELSISDVCYQSGYNDIPYFTRLFKRMQGMSPTEFRRSLSNLFPL